MIKKLTLFIGLISLSFGSYSQFDLTINPTLGSPLHGCELGIETITSTIVNVGNVPYSGSLEVGYILNAGAPVIQSVPISILGPSVTFIYSFPVDVDFSACQAHDLKIWIYDASETNHLNDTVNFIVENDCPPIPGLLTGADTVCYGINSGNVQVSGYTENPVEWLISTNSGATWTGIPVPGNDDTLAYTNITDPTLFRVIVESTFGHCPNDTSWTYALAIDGPSYAGVLPADFEICDNGNSGDIVVSGYNGSVLDWLVSTDNGTTFTSTGNYNDSLTYSNFIDTMQFQVIVATNYCPADTSGPVTLTLIPGSVAGTISGETVVCNQLNDSSLQVTGFSGDTFAWHYSLDSGATWLPAIGGDSIYDYSNLNAGTIYWASEVTLGTCPSEWSAPHIMNVLPLGTDAGPDTTIVEGESVDLWAVGGTEYFWFPDNFMNDPSSQTPTVSPDMNTTYYVEITDINGCKDTAQALVTVVPDITDLLIPNLFTPNGDGFNDNWVIANLEGFVDNEISIFNIYGQLINEYSPYNNDWDGSYNGNQLPDGTYYYIIRLNDPIYPDPIQGNVTITGNE